MSCKLKKNTWGPIIFDCSSYISKIVWWLPMFDFGSFCHIFRLMGIYRVPYLKSFVLSLFFFFFSSIFIFFIFLKIFCCSLSFGGPCSSGAPGHCPPVPPSRYATVRDGPTAEIEEFVCRLYGVSNPQEGVNEARHDLFQRGQTDLEKLPPTKDALLFHIARCNFQAKVWFQAQTVVQTVGKPKDTGGWVDDVDNDKLDMVWSSIPAVPEACVELITCGCQTQCRTARCKCCRSGQMCIPACKCRAQQCCNPVGLEVVIDM